MDLTWDIRRKTRFLASLPSSSSYPSLPKSSSSATSCISYKQRIGTNIFPPGQKFRHTLFGKRMTWASFHVEAEMSFLHSVLVSSSQWAGTASPRGNPHSQYPRGCTLLSLDVLVHLPAPAGGPTPSRVPYCSREFLHYREPAVQYDDWASLESCLVLQSKWSIPG